MLEAPRCVGARAGDAGLGDDTTAAVLGAYEEGQRRLRVAAPAKARKSSRERTGTGALPTGRQKGPSSRGNLRPLALAQQHDADLQERVEHGRRPLRPEAGSSKLAKPGFTVDPYLAQEAVSDTAELEPIVDALLAANPGQVEAYRCGKEGLLGYFVSQVLKETKGKANPRVVSELVREKPGG